MMTWWFSPRLPGKQLHLKTGGLRLVVRWLQSSWISWWKCTYHVAKPSKRLRYVYLLVLLGTKLEERLLLVAAMVDISIMSKHAFVVLYCNRV